MPEQAQPQPVKPVLKNGCPDCPPMVVPRRGYTPTRPRLHRVRREALGAAMVLLAELIDQPDDEASRRQGFSRRLRAIGHLFEAEDESQEWPDLHAAVRDARKAYQADGTMPDWAALEDLIDGIRHPE